MVLEAIRLLRRELQVPLIGFAGAPFTLASYAIEGGHSSHFAQTKGLMYGEPATWHRLAGLLADVVADYLRAQVEAGAQALQLFDSWIGALDEADYREFVLPHVRRIFDAIADLDVPEDPLRDGHRPPARGAARGRRDGDRRRLAHAARRGVEARRRRRRRPGEPRPDAPLRARASGSSPASTTCCAAPAAAPATSSTSATASCRARRSRRCGRSSSTSHEATRSSRGAASRRAPRDPQSGAIPRARLREAPRDDSHRARS